MNTVALITAVYFGIGLIFAIVLTVLAKGFYGKLSFKGTVLNILTCMLVWPVYFPYGYKQFREDKAKFKN